MHPVPSHTIDVTKSLDLSRLANHAKCVCCHTGMSGMSYLSSKVEIPTTTCVTLTVRAYQSMTIGRHAGSFSPEGETRKHTRRQTYPAGHVARH